VINVDDIKLTRDSTIEEAFKVINNGAVQIAIVVDASDRLIGTVTDGDLRRAILSGKKLTDQIQGVFNITPVVANINNTKEEVVNICSSKQIHQIPIVDSGGKVIGIELIDDLIKATPHNNKVILMVGGLGTRLRPLTEHTPKPMLPVGGKPILQTIVERFVSYGFVNIVMCIGYKSSIIQDFFGDGKKFGANIEYVLEEDRMGTAGALSLLSKNQKPKASFFVMNGDLLTNVNFEHLMDFHLRSQGKATMCVREYDFQVPYGVVETNEDSVVAITEKPVHKFFVNAGVYVLEPECIDLIPQSEFYDMPSLFDEMIRLQQKVASFPIREYWLDIGRIEEYDRANSDIHTTFN